MGRERLKKLSPGIYLRQYASGKTSIQVQFSYMGVRCRETFTGLDPTKKSHVNIAAHRLGAVKDSILKGTFKYHEHFPESRRASLFGHGLSARTVRDVGDSWLDDMKRSKPHSTYYSYWKCTNNFVYPELGSLRVRDVSPEHVRRMFRKMDVSLKTARNYSIPVKAIFERAVEDGDIERSPFERVNLRNLIPYEKRRTDYEVDPFNETEISKILAAAEQHRPDWRNYIALAVFTGLRTSELYALRWSDWTGDILHVQRARVEGQNKITKNVTSNREHQLSPAAKAALKRQRALTAFNDEIFWNPNTKRPLTRYEPSQRALDYCCKKAGVRRRIQYQTRHTYASNMLSQGASPHFVAAQMGHKSVLTLFRHYGRWVEGSATHVPLAGLTFGEGQ